MPFLLPLTNPYTLYTAEEYFAAHCFSAKVANGRRLALKAAALRGTVGRLLELGCGRGELLRGAREEGWAVFGVDMTPGYADNAGEIEIEISSVEAARSLDEQYDAIYLAAILEHLYTPHETLLRCARALVPGGVLFIDVPNECGPWTRLGNLYMRLRGRDWAVNLSPTFPPFHVVGFCPSSLTRVLMECGLNVIEMTPYTMRNQLGEGAGITGRLERLGADAALKLSGFFGLGDGILCWARKPAA